MSKYQSQFELVYPVVHRGQRNQKKISLKSQYKPHGGYKGQRYMRITDQNPIHFTTRSVYTRHYEMTQKYKYDFDPQQSKVLEFLKRRWNDQLYEYLSMFGSGYYLKKRSAKDKREFKEESNFKLKKNPLFRMMDLLDKLNYKFVVIKMSDAFQKLSQKQNTFSQSDENEIKNQEKYFNEESTLQQIEEINENESDSFSEDENQVNNNYQVQTHLRKKVQFSINKKKFMKFYDSYKDEGYGGRSVSRKLQSELSKMASQLKRLHRKILKNYSINKIIYKYESLKRILNY